MTSPKKKIAFIHTSPAAIGPLMEFYSKAAPDLEITNLLDDGLLRLLSARNLEIAQERLANMIRTARDVYRVELAMVTCSSVSREMVAALEGDFDLPILKIDYPMAQLAVRTGKRIGVAATFAPTLGPTSKLLFEAAAEAETAIEIVDEVIPEAYEALLTADYQKHDDLLLAGINRLERQNVSIIVLAQVSMARILSRIDQQVAVPVLSSLQTSLDAIQTVMKT